MEHGTVQWFDTERGFGFISPDHGVKDLFVHHSEIQAAGMRVLTEGQRVEFQSATGPKGPVAKQVKAL
ncbi:cold-shock protein [Nocardia cyriacigeorgica]|uniref:cold-shock protein n=1 Tax=Nocardia TaxID=1817 RepID=UPI00189404FB|nr:MULTISPECIES: cold-shock protein [Nocardia]MBF6102289.1 cold-shock protein [Nocardia cyriacigeorgica]